LKVLISMKPFPFITQMELIWVVLVVIVIEKFEMYQMDVKIAFLDGDIFVQICICNDHKVLWSR
jgi:hypothetical protein